MSRALVAARLAQHGKENHLSRRRVRIDVDTIDVHPLHQFVGSATPSERALAWICTVAAEPNAERMSHVAGVNVEAGCARDVGVPQRRGSRSKAKHSIGFSEAEDFAVGIPRAAFLQNGWAPAPVPVRGVDFTFQSIQKWADELSRELVAHAPVASEDEIFLATDGSAKDPAHPDTRVAAFAVA